jgi:outer membrane protein TolC
MEAERFAKETYDLAEGRYKAGVGDSLEISDAIESYAAAQAETVLSLYNCKEAQLDLEKAMGGLDNESK